MPPIAYRVTVSGTLNGGDIWQNVHHVLCAASAQTVADLMGAEIISEYLGTSGANDFGLGVDGVHIKVRDFNVATGVPGTDMGSYDADWHGGPNGSLPNEVACCVTTRTADFTIHGRYYLPPFEVGLLATDGTYDLTALGGVAGAQQTYWHNLIVGDPFVTPCVYSVTHRSMTEWTALQLGNVPASQRRRRNAVTESRITETLG